MKSSRSGHVSGKQFPKPLAFFCQGSDLFFQLQIIFRQFPDHGSSGFLIRIFFVRFLFQPSIGTISPVSGSALSIRAHF
jgi:hypothetical protein